MILRAGAALALAIATLPAHADPPDLHWPVDCVPGRSCFVQNHVDRDPGPGVLDAGCGGLSYDGHTGTDIALRDHVALSDGVAVRAAADGTILRLRDDMADWDAAPFPVDRLAGRFCGNGVVIAHTNGWQTQYCHLRAGSVSVAPGDKVLAGDAIGQIGLSGRTEFPHLHFTLRQNGRVVDPYAPAMTGCAAGSDDTLWAMPVDYVPTGLVNLGIADHLPDFAAVKDGAIATQDLATDAPALVFWAQIFGAQDGDVMDMELTGPAGEIATKAFALTRDQARIYRAIGKKRRAAAWPAGTYRAMVRLIRDDTPILSRSFDITLP